MNMKRNQNRNGKRNSGRRAPKPVTVVGLFPNEMEGEKDICSFWMTNVMRRSGTRGPGIEIIVDEKLSAAPGGVTIGGGRHMPPISSVAGIKVYDAGDRDFVLRASHYRVRPGFRDGESRSDRIAVIDGKERFDTSLGFKTFSAEGVADLLSVARLHVVRLSLNADDWKEHGTADKVVKRSYL